MQLDDETLPAYLVTIGALESAEGVSVEIPGDGNINYVRRARHPASPSVVCKQARPSLERFPEYTVSTDRILFEHRYMETVTALTPEVAPLLPRVLHFDAEARVLVLEDLGAGPTLEGALLQAPLPPGPFAALGRFLGTVHGASSLIASDLSARFENDEMRALHGEHIFTLPFEPNDFPISAELADFARRALRQADAHSEIARLRERYYESAEALVHADVQAGNILLQGQVPRLLDAEIAHVGDPAFDLGVALAHVRFHSVLAGERAAHRDAEVALLKAYAAARGPNEDIERADRYCGVEMLRRSIGAARPEFLHAPEPAREVFSAGLSWLLG